jgi:carboxyl-terminal processing protease
MPDIFVPIDTTGASMYYSELSFNGIIRRFGFEYVDQHRSDLDQFSLNDFINRFQPDAQLMDDFISFSESEGVEKDEFGLANSRTLIEERIKAHIAKNLFDDNAFYRVLLEADPDVIEARGAFAKKNLLTINTENN